MIISKGGGGLWFLSLFLLKFDFMYKVKDKFKGCLVTCAKFIVEFDNATQEQLEHLYHLGHKGIDFVGSKKPKNKIVDNLSSETEQSTNE